MTITSPSQVTSPRTTYLTQTYVAFNQESATEQRFTEDMDHDDAAISQMLFNAYRKRVDHSAGEGLLSGLSSLSMSQDRTGQPVVEGHEQIRTGPAKRANPR